MFAKSMLRGAALMSLTLFSVAFRSPPPTPFPDFDKRPQDANVSVEKQKAFADLRVLANEASVQFDPVTHSAVHVAATRGFLSGPNGQGGAVANAALNAFPQNDPHRATKAFLKQHRELFGHGPEALDSTTVKQDYVTAHNGLHTVAWEQRVDDIPVFEGLLVSHTTAKGELVSVSSHFVSDTARAALLAKPNRLAKLTAAQAIERAAQSFEIQFAPAEITLLEPPSGAEQKHRFRVRQLVGDTSAELTWLPVSKDELRLCWNVVLKIRSRGEFFRALVDAETGGVILRRCLTAYVTNSTYRVFTSDSPSPFSPGNPTPLTNQPSLVSRDLVTFTALNTNASPAGWIDDGTNETLGNNVDAHLDRDDDDNPDLPRPQGSPFHVFDPPLDLTQSPLLNSDASVVQLFYWCNFMHDKLYDLGFTEPAGNFQINNFGRGGASGDPVQADAQDGGGFNNANMSTFGDGLSPRLQMYIFNGSNPDRDGALDGEVVLHEYTHGLSTRLVGSGVGIYALQAEGMGEGWSDFYALSLLSEPADDVNAVYAMAGYATYQYSGLLQNYYFGIRRYPYCTDMTKNPLTFRDIDPTQASSHPSVPSSPAFGGGGASEVHNQGEVWCVTLWEARALLISKYGWTNGNQLMLQLVTDGMKLSPANPTFLQARDAILLADQIDNNGTNYLDLWAAFAKRGLGASATSPSSSTTTGVHEAFDLPDDLKIFPNGGFTAKGPVGGPFDVTNQVFTLKNTGSNALNWITGSTANWLSVSPSGASLATGVTATVTISLNSGANVLSTGLYFGAIWFTNTTSGLSQSRTISLHIAQPDYFTKLFVTNFNIQNTAFTFTPNGTTSFYSVCRENVASYFTAQTGGTVLPLTDDSSQQITLTGTNTILLYGRPTSSIYVGSNGYLTYDGPDTEYRESFAQHFNQHRVSGFFRDFNPSQGGTISWKQLPDRLAVTWDKLTEYARGNSNSFQVEMFFDGRVRLTYLHMDAKSGLIGLSKGGGVPAGFDESDFSSYANCAAAPVVSLTRTGGNAIVSWTTAPGRTYRVETNSILGNSWSTAGSDMVATGLISSITNVISAPQIFYRVHLLP